MWKVSVFRWYVFCCHKSPPEPLVANLHPFAIVPPLMPSQHPSWPMAVASTWPHSSRISNINWYIDLNLNSLCSRCSIRACHIYKVSCHSPFQLTRSGSPTSCTSNLPMSLTYSLLLADTMVSFVIRNGLLSTVLQKLWPCRSNIKFALFHPRVRNKLLSRATTFAILNWLLLIQIFWRFARFAPAVSSDFCFFVWGQGRWILQFKFTFGIHCTSQTHTRSSIVRAVQSF